MIRTAKALWKGGLRDGHGEVELGSGTFKGKYSFGTRFEDSAGTNPEELIGAAHAGCFAMALSSALGGSGYIPEELAVSAKVHLEKGDVGFAIEKIELKLSARIPGIEKAEFIKLAEGAKANCPVSKALSAVQITLDATLL